jgi:hypothetical protein
MLQKKKQYKEDLTKDILEGKSRGQAGGYNGKEEVSTMSDDHASGNL